MRKLKTIILLSLIVSLTLMIIGCGLLAKPEISTEEISGQTGELPVWLSLAHYEATDQGDSLGDPIESGDTENDFFVGPSAQSYETAPTPTPAPQQPTTTNSAGPNDTALNDDSTPPPPPGTMAYILWQKEQREAYEEQVREERRQQEEEETTMQQRVWEMTGDSLLRP